MYQAVSLTCQSVDVVPTLSLVEGTPVQAGDATWELDGTMYMDPIAGGSCK